MENLGNTGGEGEKLYEMSPKSSAWTFENITFRDLKGSSSWEIDYPRHKDSAIRAKKRYGIRFVGYEESEER